jgi:hypothetical protein
MVRSEITTPDENSKTHYVLSLSDTPRPLAKLFVASNKVHEDTFHHAHSRVQKTETNSGSSTRTSRQNLGAYTTHKPQSGTASLDD